MKYTNAQMDVMTKVLEKHLNRRDVIGYAAARNMRTLANELATFYSMRDELIKEYGEEEVDGDGNKTGNILVKQNSARFQEFMEKFTPLAVIEHEPNIFKLKFDEAIDKITGAELLEIEWMFEE